MSETIHIGVGRRTVAAAAAFFGLFTVIGVSRGWNAHSTTAVVIVAVACGVPFAYYARENVAARPGACAGLQRDGVGPIAPCHPVG
jgi:hypothetical protein